MPAQCQQFLSCLYGSEPQPAGAGSGADFLSCLYGSEQLRTDLFSDDEFLSCLYGSELKYYTFSPLLIKQNHLNLLLPPFFILTYPQH
ncbi:hypothetical protein A8535_002645 [Escherichia coli]|nr:hypothetical protein [Escherichia coli]